MDEQVKVRLIGATVLVVLAVVLVPELLSGPKRATGVDAEATEDKRGTRTITIDLGTTGANKSSAQVIPETARAPRDNPRLPTVDPPGMAAESRQHPATASTTPTIATAPPRTPASVPRVGANAASSATVSNTPTELKTTVPVTVPASSKIAEPKPASTTVKGGWSVQVGAFGSVDSARNLVADLRRDGLSVYVAPLDRGGKTLHRVRVGPAPTRADADKLAVRLKGRGLPAAVVTAD